MGLFVLLIIFFSDLPKGDTVGLEMEVFERKMSVALFSKNYIPVGTRFLTLKKHKHFFPTVALCANGCDVVIDVVWQNRVAAPPIFSMVSVSVLFCIGTIFIHLFVQ